MSFGKCIWENSYVCTTKYTSPWPRTLNLPIYLPAMLTFVLHRQQRRRNRMYVCMYVQVHRACRPGVGWLSLPKTTALNSQNEVVKDQMALYSTAWTTGAWKTLADKWDDGENPATYVCTYICSCSQSASCPISQNLLLWRASVLHKLNKKRSWNWFFDTPPWISDVIRMYKITTGFFQRPSDCRQSPEQAREKPSYFFFVLFWAFFFALSNSGFPVCTYFVSFSFIKLKW